MKHSQRIVRAAFALALPLVLVWPATAQPTPEDEVSAKPSAAAMKAAAGRKGKEGPKRFPEAKEVLKDMEAIEGLFTLYRYDPKDKNRDPEKLLAKIPRGLLDEDLLFASSIYSGGPMTGYMWNDHLVRWKVVGKYLKMITPDVRYVQKRGEPVTDVVERTYRESFIAAVPIVSMTGGGDVIVDLERLLKSNIANVSFLGGGVRSELSTWKEIKNFPDNILIDVDLALGRGGGGTSVGVAYAFRRLPQLGSYSPREADPRVGYFLTVRKDWTKPESERELFDRYVNRWKLEKVDPSLELSPPKEPIVFIVEKTVPIQWRRWVRDGIREWNKAFERIGFVDAIVVQQQTEDNEYADYDPEDARYNFFRWIVSGRAFAMGPSRADPRTGQILDADIIMDDSFVRAWMYDFDVYAPSSLVSLKGPGFKHWLETSPEMAPDFLKAQLASEIKTPEEQLWEQIDAHMHEQGQCSCAYGEGMSQQVSILRHAMIATGSSGKKLPERYIGEAIRAIVIHEVGHTLGLRHNFKASSWLSLDEIKRRRMETDKPTTASIMDYNPLLFFAGDELEQVRHFMTPTIGPYDEWAIAYGYALPEKGQSEKDLLHEITKQCTKPEYQYATDEDNFWVFSPDPLVNTYDLSSNPMDWAAARVELCDQLLSNITEWAVQEGEPRYFLTRAFNELWFEKSRNFDYVARLVGGQYFHRDHVGDPDARPAFVLVDPELQRKALAYLGDTIFSSSFFKIDPELINNLAPSRWRHWGTGFDFRLDYPIHDRVRSSQLMSLMDLLAGPVLQRIYDAELKSTSPDKFTTAELLTALRDELWSELDEGVGRRERPTDAKPFIDSLRRNLQREHLNVLLSMAEARPGLGVPADIQSMVRHVLRGLSEKIDRALSSNLDFASEAHLTEAKSRIDRVLEAQFIAR